MYLLGIDIGTSSTKSTIYDYSGKTVAQACRPYTFEVERSGYAEQDPRMWWKATAESVREAVSRADVRKEQIRGIGFSGQMHGLVGLDADRKPVRKAILHCDVRAKEEADSIAEKFGDRYTKIVYNPIFPGFQATSLYWLKTHEPESFAKIRTVVCPKDYVRYRMTGELGTDHSDASGTLFYDNRECRWSDEVFDMLGFDRSVVPEDIGCSFEVAGTVTEEAAGECGLEKGTPVVFGGADQAMQSLGNGVYAPGDMMATIGTSGQVLMISESPKWNEKLNTHIFHHADRGVWFGLGAVLFAGSTLNWFRRNFAEDMSYDQLSQLAQGVEPGSNGLTFLPCMGGERTPYLDPLARGVFNGVSMVHTRAHFARAIMEGVSFAMKSSIAEMENLFGSFDRLICAGGGVKGETWARIQADIYGREIHVSRIKEQACLGAAIVAAIGAGVYGSVRESCGAMCDGDMKTITPDEKNVKLYKNIFDDIYVKIYDQNAALFHKMAELNNN